MNLDGKIAVVTGGAMGNGLGIVQVFLKLGATVVILDRDDKLGETLHQLRQTYSNVIGYKVDITDRDLVNRCVKKEYEMIAIKI